MFASAMAQEPSVTELSLSTTLHGSSDLSELEPEIGKNPLWVAKQHGHSIATMLRAYAAWAEGAAEVDVKAIKRAMKRKIWQ